MITVRVPATTANFGPGFDSLGAALNLFNEFSVEAVHGVHEFYWCGSDVAACDEDNLVLRALRRAFAARQYHCSGFRIRTQRCDIPMNRGLGSSASAIVAGLLAANALMGLPLSHSELVRLAVEMEGHPDNVVPCLEGGLRVVVCEEDGTVVSAEIPVAAGLEFAVLIPEFGLPTAQSRGILPRVYAAEDAVHNVSRTALLVASLFNGQFDHLQLALQDRMHQRQRMPLIPAAGEVMMACNAVGSLGQYISGAGPTIVAFMPAGEEWIDQLRSLLMPLPGRWRVQQLEIWRAGAVVEVNV